jgi:hypothetical protein
VVFAGALAGGRQHEIFFELFLFHDVFSSRVRHNLTIEKSSVAQKT